MERPPGIAAGLLVFLSPSTGEVDGVRPGQARSLSVLVEVAA